MVYRFDFRAYRRPFKQPLHTNHGIWEMREGIIIHLCDIEGNCGCGEIAPVSWFGSETLAQALDFCRHLPDSITEQEILSIPHQLPACQFGFESALECLNHKKNKPLETPDFHYSALLPPNQTALSAFKPLWQRGYRTFKLKIGIAPIAEELKIFKQLTQQLPADAKLRLDANGGLNYPQASEWLKAADDAGIVEFFEQPLPVTELPAMLDLTTRYSTCLALDESTATIAQIQDCYLQGWRGIFVIKPSIAGSPSQLRRFCQSYPIDAVFSSVFETAVGRNAALKLAAQIQSFHAENQQKRALGFGVNHWFADKDETWIEQLWETI